MICNLVLNHLYSKGMRSAHKFLVFLQITEVLFDRIVVHRAVAVIIGDWLPIIGLALIDVIVVIVNGGQPNGGHAEILEIGQPVDHPLKITGHGNSGACLDREAHEKSRDHRSTDHRC